MRSVVYRPFPTSNHNYWQFRLLYRQVVYRPFPTSNHNVQPLMCRMMLLYIVRFLHQTTTRTCIWTDNDMLYIVRFLHQTTTYNI